MPVYSYQAVSSKGEKIKGQEQAADEQELSLLLKERGLVLTLAKAQKKRDFSWLSRILATSFGVSLSEKLLFVRNLKVMVGAGISLPRALDVLAKQSENRTFQKALKEIKDQVVRGTSFSQAMEAYPGIFPEIFTNMIKVGEESGTLEEVLSNLALQLEKQHELRSKIVGALTYPAVVVLAMIGIGILMLAVVVPNLAKTFEDLGVALPPTTRFVIALGRFLSEQWYLALGIVVAGTLGIFRALGTSQGKRLTDRMFLRIPIAAGIVRKTNAAVTLRTLSSLIASGVPIVRSLEITSHVVGNSFYKDILMDAAKEVRKGTKLSEALERFGTLYPLLVVQMVEVGEETGQSAEVLGRLAEFYEEEVERITQNLASVIEPVLMLIVGSMVGFFAISMIQPMYSMLGSLQGQ